MKRPDDNGILHIKLRFYRFKTSPAIESGFFVPTISPIASPPCGAFLFLDRPMTDVSQIADSTVFKLVVPVLQTILSAGAIGAFVYVVGSLSALQAQLGTYQTNQALLTQRVESLERSRDSGEKIVDTLRTSDQRQDFKIESMSESLKSLFLNGRPK